MRRARRDRELRWLPESWLPESWLPERPRSERGPALWLLALWLAACGQEPEPPPCALLITIDTTNPGALDIYGTDRGLTPRLAGLASSALVFEQARTVAPLTLPAHSSIMTGLYPLRHGVRDNGLWPLPESARTLAERARSAGYQTAAFVSAVVLSSDYGIAQGFELFDEPRGATPAMGEYMLERSAREVTTLAQRWIRERDRERPFFLWVHYFDPHAPYEPPPAYLELAAGSAYLGEVAAMDAEIGNLLDTLEGEVGLDKALVAVVADHGESLGRHQEPTHSIYCYDATMRVPLLLHLPHAERAGERSRAIVSVVDLYPTLLEALELGSPGDVDGVSLLHAREDEARGVYVESYCGYLNYGWSPLEGWVDASGKYLFSSRPELFALKEDPAEEHNLWRPGSPRAQPYREAIAELARRPRLARGERDASGPSMSAQLRALGYAGAASTDQELPEPLTPSERPAPSERARELAAFYEAALLANAGRRPEAIGKLRELAREEPDNVYARAMLAGLLVEELRFEEARELLEGLLAGGHDRFTVRLQLATSLESLGELARARTQYEAALREKPGDPQAAEGLERVLSRLR